MNEKSRRTYLWLPTLLALVIFAFGVTGCASTEQSEGEAESETIAESQDESAADAGSDTVAIEEEVWPPEHIVVQHVLIGFAGSVPGKNVTRSKEAAEALAADIYKRAQDGEDFGALVVEYTDDSAPGFYFLANNDIEPTSTQEYPRGEMVKGFGDAAFELKMGDVGIANYEEKASPFGWHIIKRVQSQ